MSDKVTKSEKKVLDFVDRVDENTNWENITENMYKIEKAFASGKRLNAVQKIEMRQKIAEFRQYLQKCNENNEEK